MNKSVVTTPKMENKSDNGEKRYLCERMRFLRTPEIPPPEWW